MSSVKRLINFLLWIQFLIGLMTPVINSFSLNENLPEYLSSSEVIQEEMPCSFPFAEVPPSFLYGQDSLLKYVYTNLEWPKGAPCSMGGTIVISITIDRFGQPIDYQVLKGLHPTFDEEALKVLKKIKRWNPGKLNGTPVRSQFNLPIRIRLE